LAKALVDPPENVTAEIPEDDSVKVLDNFPPETPSRKRRARKLKGPLDFRFLCKSERLKKSCRGFKDAASTVAAETEGVLPTDTTTPEVALAIVPILEGSAANASTSAPHLPTAVVKAIGIEFLKMQPQHVSDAALLASDDD
jgi:hypothetical protein